MLPGLDAAINSVLTHLINYHNIAHLLEILVKTEVREEIGKLGNVLLVTV